MRILLVGATGQIGHALTTELAKTEHHVSVLVRSRGELTFPEDVEVIQFPGFDASAYGAALDGIEHVIYAAGMPAQFVFDDTIFQRVNVDLLRTLLEQLPGSVRSLTYLSTYEVFRAIDGVISESHPLADPSEMTPYFRSMFEAFRLVSQFGDAGGVQVTTIHPAAAYGGRNTGRGITDYLENLRRRRVWVLPFIFDSRFPVVHVDSLADAVIRSLGVPGAFIVSDQMTSLQEIAGALRNHADSYMPPTAPVRVAELGTHLMEALAHVTRRPPMLSRVQIEFLTKGWEPVPDRARTELGWEPLPLEQGILRYLGRDGGL